MLKAASELGLTPSSRSRVQIAAGTSSDPYHPHLNPMGRKPWEYGQERIEFFDD